VENELQDSTQVHRIDGRGTDLHRSVSQRRTQGTADQAQITQLEAQAIVDREVIAALTEQGIVDQAQIDNLKAALVTSRRIGAAIGILMANRRIDESAAFELLRQNSQATNRKLRDVADSVLYTGALDT
jgi:hypothetical protein